MGQRLCGFRPPSFRVHPEEREERRLVFLLGLGGGFFDCNLYAGLFDVVAPRFRSAAMGMYLCGAFFLGSQLETVPGARNGDCPRLEMLDCLNGDCP